MSPQIETLKTELREFISLSETITPGRWVGCAYPSEYEGRQISEFTIYTESTHPEGSVNNWQVCSGYGNLCTRFPPKKQGFTNAAFIARSRNISPTMAKMLLEVIEINECRAVWIAPCKAFPNGTPDNTSASTIQAILNRWNETK
jgi:hypothetical protein